MVPNEISDLQAQAIALKLGVSLTQPSLSVSGFFPKNLALFDLISSQEFHFYAGRTGRFH
jgi:hypothetical protein